VAERPNDAEGLALLARHEASLGNLAAAHAAQARLVAVKGEAATAADFADLADLRILAAGGYVSPEAEAALTEALARDPRNPVARYYSGLMHAQTGRPDLAFRFWSALLAEGPPDAPWIAPIRAQIEEIAWLAGQHNFRLPPEGPPPPGPTAEQMEAAQGMTPQERQDMIRGMVGALAERLATEGGPAEDWARLIRAYAVLGEAERVAPVVAEARTRFAGDAAGLGVIEAAARDAGIAE
jgi:cytochrome c-type biogenesis protein CcmH